MEKHRQYSLWNVALQGERAPTEDEMWLFTGPFRTFDVGMSYQAVLGVMMIATGLKPGSIRSIGHSGNGTIAAKVVIRRRDVAYGDWVRIDPDSTDSASSRRGGAGLAAVQEAQSKFLPEVCMIPACGCDGNQHP